MIQPLALAKSPTKSTTNLIKSRVLTQTKPDSSKTKQNNLSVLSKTERKSPMSQSVLVENKLNKSTLASPKSFKGTNSNITLSRTQSNINFSQFKAQKSPTSPGSQLSSRPATKITTKTTFTPKPSTNRSMIKSEILSRSKIVSPTNKSTIIKSKVTSKPAIPSFTRKPTVQSTKPGSKITNSKLSPKMQVISQQPNNQILYPIQIQQLENKVKTLIVQNSKHMLEVDCLKLELYDKVRQNQQLEEELVKRQGQKMVQALNNRILSCAERSIEIQFQALLKLNQLNQQKVRKLQNTVAQKDKTISQIMVTIQEYDAQLMMITEQLKQVEKQTVMLFGEKAELQKASTQFQENNSMLSKSILVKDQEVSQLKTNIVTLTKTWQNRYRNLEDQLEHSKQQYLKKQRDLEATRMILEEERGKSFQANQQLMTMFTQTDVKNEEQIERLHLRIEQLEDNLRSYENILEKMEKDIESQELRKQDFEATRDSEMDSLEELLSKIKEEGKQFLRLREKEVEKREHKRMQSSIR